MNKKLQRSLSFVLVALSVASFTVSGWFWESGKLSVSARSPSLSIRPSPAVQQVAQESGRQRVRVQEVWRIVYQQLPDFPLENNYVSKETGKVDPENTLAGRLIRYHLFVKGRPGDYRLDWKLTLADYLGATPDFWDEALYPGGDVLKENPMDRDREAIRRLNRTQRDALIQVLVNAFSGDLSISAPPPNRTPARSNPSEPPPQPKPGDAQLLMP